MRGVYPTEGGSAWEDVDMIYGVGHVNDNHWVAYEVRTQDHLIVVYGFKGRRPEAVQEFR